MSTNLDDIVGEVVYKPPRKLTPQPNIEDLLSPLSDDPPQEIIVLEKNILAKKISDEKLKQMKIDPSSIKISKPIPSDQKNKKTTKKQQ